MPLLSAAALVAVALAANDEPAAFVSKIPAPPKDAAAAYARCKGGTDSAVEPVKQQLQDIFQRMNQQLAAQAMGVRSHDVRLMQEVSQVTLSASQAMQPTAQQLRADLEKLDQKMSGIEAQRLEAIDACPVVKGEATGPEAGCEKAANEGAKKAKIAAIDAYLGDASKTFAGASEAAQKSIASMDATIAKATKAGAGSNVVGLQSMRWQLVSQVISATLNPCTFSADRYPAAQQ